MTSALLLFRDSAAAASLCRYLRSSRRFDDAKVLEFPSSAGGDTILTCYRVVAATLDELCRAWRLASPPPLVIAELHHPGADTACAFNPLGSEAPALHALAMLTLAFPEAHFVFWAPCAPDVVELPAAPLAARLGRAHVVRCTAELKQVLESRDAGWTPLFDPGGVRTMLLRRAQAACPEGEDLSYLPCRRKMAAAVDEELDYAALHGYALYRTGHRTQLVTRFRLFEKLFEANDVDAGVPLNGYDVVVEDVYLSFPDREAGTHLSNLEDRDGQYRLLPAARRRVIVTVGGGGERNCAAWRANLRYLRAGRACGERTVVLYKPTTGILPLVDKLAPHPRRTPSSRALGPRGSGGQEPLGHSAPGRFLVIAESLLARCRAGLDTARSAHEAVVAATLALEARELLGRKTPTVTLEALALQHEAEVTAESLFIGVEHNLDLEERFREIRREVRAVARWFHRKTRRRSELNSRLTIIERLAKRFADLHQVEEEMACLAEARRLRFDFWVRERWYRWPMWPVLRYLALALKSLPAFAGILVGWAVLFGLSYYMFAHASPRGGAELWDAMVSAWKVFFTGEPAAQWAELAPGGGNAWNTWWTLWLTFQGIISFTSLGLLLSHLYLIVSRR